MRCDVLVSNSKEVRALSGMPRSNLSRLPEKGMPRAAALMQCLNFGSG